MWRDLVARGEHARRAAPRARRRRRASRRARCSSASGAARAARPARPARPAARRRPRTRATGTAKIAPIDARTALGPNGIGACPGPSATLPAPNASAAAQHRADVARVADAPQRDAQRPAGRRAQRCVVDRRARACPSRARRPSASSVRRDLLAVQARARGDEPRRRRPARGVGGGEQVLALGHERAQLVAPLAARELADLLELVVVGAGDHGHGTKRAPLRWRGAREAAGVVGGSGRPTPRGRSRQIGGRSRGRARRCRPAPCGRARCRPA